MFNRCPDSFLSLSGGRVLFDIRRRPKGQVGTILLPRAYFQFHTGNVALFPIFSDNLLDRATHCGLRSPFCVFFYSANTLFLLTKGLDRQIPAH